MKRIYVLLAVIAAVKCWQLSDLVRDEWTSFKLEYKKQYENAEEERHRMIIYLEKRHMISKHNRRYHRGLESFSLKTNQFSDMTHEEYVKIANGFKPVSRKEKPLKIEGENDGQKKGLTWINLPPHSVEIKNLATMFVSPANVMIDESVDWRQAGAVSRIQDQGDCNSCWAFSAVGALEGQLFRKKKPLVPLSVQNLIDCSYRNHGCLSGNPKVAFIYIQENKGIDIEKYYPYEAKKNICRYNLTNSGGYDNGYVLLHKGEEDELKKAVATIGPVSVSVDATLESFAAYSKGVYYDSKCTERPNHSLLVVGFGTDKKEGDYWLLKNSYGTTWGEDGYMRLARNRQNHCGITSYAVYPLIPE